MNVACPTRDRRCGKRHGTIPPNQCTGLRSVAHRTPVQTNEPVPTLSGTMGLTAAYVSNPEPTVPLQEAHLSSSRVLDPSWLIAVLSPGVY